MKIIKKINNNLITIINYLEVITILFSIIILGITLVKSIYFYFTNLFDDDKIFDINKRILQNISFALSFILILELFKLFYIKHFKHLIIVISITLLKVILAFFIEKEVDHKIFK
tara:strand:+ start:2113 stop:2454 length:342 start_codon:yes stop_codon:yes gene_type:complete